MKTIWEPKPWQAAWALAALLILTTACHVSGAGYHKRYCVPKDLSFDQFARISCCGHDPLGGFTLIQAIDGHRLAPFLVGYMGKSLDVLPGEHTAEVYWQRGGRGAFADSVQSAKVTFSFHVEAGRHYQITPELVDGPDASEAGRSRRIRMSLLELGALSGDSPEGWVGWKVSGSRKRAEAEDPGANRGPRAGGSLEGEPGVLQYERRHTNHPTRDSL